ncbi:MAG: pilus assembly protein PilM [Nitrospirales bacterium]|nr:MAG: pilus assembly protein PilM [Nitrospirales bacterium]
MTRFFTKKYDKSIQPFWAMLYRKFRPSSHYLGLDIGSRLIKIVQLKYHAGEWHLSDVRVKDVSIETDTPIDNSKEYGVVEVLRCLIMDMGIEGENVAISLSGPSVIMKPIEMPWMSEEELKGHLEWEVERYLPYEREDVYWDYYVPQRSQQHHKSSMLVYLVAAKKNIVDQRVALVRQAGLCPVVVDIDCVALANMYTLHDHVSEKSPGLLINVSPSGLNMITVGKPEHFSMRDAALGGEWDHDLFGEEGSQGVRVDETDDNEQVEAKADFDELLNEVYREILYEVRRAMDDCHLYENGQAVQQIWLCGGYAHLPGLVARLSSQLHVPVNIINSFHHLNKTDMADREKILDSLPSVAAVAVGLALRCSKDQ